MQSVKKAFVSIALKRSHLNAPFRKGTFIMKTFPISHFNGSRGENELVVYTGAGRTGTNRYGLEACVLHDRVISCSKNNNQIPEDGYVLSGHGKAAAFLSDSLCVGAKVTIDKEKNLLLTEIDFTTLQQNADSQISTIEKRLSERIAEGATFDRKNAEDLLEKAKQAKNEGDFESVKRWTEEAYYLTARSVPDEVRAVWHRPIEQNEQEVEATVRRFRNAGFNLMLIETNYEGYANAQRCVHDFLPIQPQYRDGFDVIEAFIRIGKQNGMKIHAWFEDFFFGVTYTGCAIAELHPEWMARRKDGGLLHDSEDTFYFLNPALQEVRDFLLALCRELLDRYDFDGLQLDYIRYPVIRGIERSAGFEEQTKELFLQETGIRLDEITTTECAEWKAFTEWRAEKITSYVASIHGLIAEYRASGRNIQLSTAVFGDPDEAIQIKCQDWRRWVKNGWLDAIYPMAYFNHAEDVGSEVAYMVSNYGEAPNISGIAPMYSHLPIIESTKQVEECRKAGASGVAFFAAHSCTDEQLEKLRIGVFRED